MKKRRIIMALLLVCLMLTTGTVMASGDGTGGGQDDPLELVASSVSDGAVDVAVDATIRMEFNKNVTFDTVRAGNMAAFSLEDENGSDVGIDVILADATNRDERDFINVEFTNDLEPDTSYTLTAATSLQSKSGDNPAAPIVIEFTTRSAAAAATSGNPETGSGQLSMVLVFVAMMYVMAYVGVKAYKRQAN